MLLYLCSLYIYFYTHTHTHTHTLSLSLSLCAMVQEFKTRSEAALQAKARLEDEVESLMTKLHQFSETHTPLTCRTNTMY